MFEKRGESDVTDALRQKLAAKMRRAIECVEDQGAGKVREVEEKI